MHSETRYTLLSQYSVPTAKAAAEHQVFDALDKWPVFNQNLAAEKLACGPGEEIKVIYMHRHGHGEHNRVPNPPMPHWSGLLANHGKVNRGAVDPALSPIGQEQMSHLVVELQEQFKQGLLPPTKTYTSVTVRTCQSAVEVWRKALDHEIPIVAMQDLRGTLNGEGFSRRGPLEVVRARFPDILIEEGTTENDDLWQSTGGLESEAQVGTRTKNVFTKIWSQSKDQDCISIVTHKEFLYTLWTQVFGLQDPHIETAEIRIIVLKRSEG